MTAPVNPGGKKGTFVYPRTPAEYVAGHLILHDAPDRVGRAVRCRSVRDMASG